MIKPAENYNPGRGVGSPPNYGSGVGVTSPTKICSGIPCPTGRQNPDTVFGRLRVDISRLKPGSDQYFDWNGVWQNEIYRAAKETGARITTRKLDNGGWRIWRRE